MEKLEMGSWRVLELARTAPRAFDSTSKLAAIEPAGFVQLPRAEQLRALYSALDVGEMFRFSDLMRAFQRLGADDSSTLRTTLDRILERDEKAGLVRHLDRGVWVLQEVAPRHPVCEALDVPSVAASIDLDLFRESSRPDRVRLIYNALVPGTLVRSRDLTRVYTSLEAGKTSTRFDLSSVLLTDVKRGYLEKVGRGVWKVIAAAPVELEPLRADVAEQLARIELDAFDSLTESDQVRTVYEVLGESGPFRSRELVRAFQSLDVSVPPRTNIAMILKRDLERGHVERLEPGMWVLADS